MDHLISEMLSRPGSIFVEIDGCAFADISSSLNAEGLHGEPTYKADADRELLLAGPWVVPAGRDERVIRKALSLCRRHHTGICWEASCDLPEIIRHIRILGIAQTPEYGIVYFRHYDPNFLASIITTLSAEQAARLFGPAGTIGFASGAAEGCTVAKPENLCDPPSGPLAFTQGQVEMILQRQHLESQEKIGMMLRNDFPGVFAKFDESKMNSFVNYHEQDARSMGLKTEKAIYYWTYFSVKNAGRMDEERRAVSRLRLDKQDGASLDAHFVEMMDAVTS